MEARMIVRPMPEQTLLSDLNTTPLIDVLLVLLVMFIITIPIQTHSVKLDLPGGPPPVAVNLDRNRVVLTERGQTLWNGTPVTLPQLGRQLAAVAAMPDQPEVQLQPESGTRYALVDEVLAMTKRAKIERLGFIGNERYARF
jgi:biopolymer transport protein ExbD